MKTFKNPYSKLTVVLLVLTAGLFSCKKDSSVSPAASSGSRILFGVTASNSLATASASKSVINSTGGSSPAITWTAGTASISRFKFEAKRNGVEKEFSSKGMVSVDLFAPDTAFVNTAIDTGTYSEIEVKVDLAKSASSSALILKGTFTKADGTTVPVELDVNDNLEIKAEAQNVFIDKTTNLKTTLILHLNALFEGVSNASLESATLTGGSIIISSSSNSDIFNQVMGNLQNIGETHFEGEHQHGNDDNGDNSGHGNGGDDHGGDG